MMVKAKINGLALDVTSNSPVVILAPENSEKVLPIWIGHFEAWAIAMELSGVPAKRPMTHDLLQRVIETSGSKVKKVEVTELKDQTFFAMIYLQCDGKTYEIDARPSDSIALALKTKAPIFVNEELFQSRKGEDEPKSDYDPETLKERLRNIKPEDFGQYSLE
jgi:bifunctional DNase/RNase